MSVPDSGVLITWHQKKSEHARFALKALLSPPPVRLAPLKYLCSLVARELLLSERKTIKRYPLLNVFLRILFLLKLKNKMYQTRCAARINIFFRWGSGCPLSLASLLHASLHFGVPGKTLPHADARNQASEFLCSAMF